MGRRPESMERWEVVDIFKEAATLLPRHLRLFMPFFLAFWLPASFLSVFQSVFIKVATGPPLDYTSFDNDTALYNIAQDVLQIVMQPSLILTCTLWLLGVLFGSLALTAFTYIVAHIYSNVDTESDDDSIVKKVFKLLRLRALFRICVTHLWGILAWIPVDIACVTFATILFGTGPSDRTPTFFFLNMEVSYDYLIGAIAVTIMFALAQPITLLEPEKYGRAALQLSIKYVKGRAGTTFCIAIFSLLIGELRYAAAQAVAKAGLSLGVKIVVASLLSILSSVVSAYVGSVFVVMYFVCRSTFEAVLPQFQHGNTRVKSAADGMNLMRPDSMESWGLVSIFKEAGRLLRKHFRLFMPFFLAFQLPASSLSVFQNVFLVAAGPPIHHNSFVSGTGPQLDYKYEKLFGNDTGPQLYYQTFVNVTGPQVYYQKLFDNGTGPQLDYKKLIGNGTGPQLYYQTYVNVTGPELDYKKLFGNGTGPQLYYKSFVNDTAYTTAQGAHFGLDTAALPSFILTYTVWILGLLFATWALAAFTYIVPYIYSNADTKSDNSDSITKRVFKLLPHAYLRIFVTRIWELLVWILIAIAGVMLVGTGPSGPTPAFLLFMVPPFVIGIIGVTIVFMFAQSIAVLEPENYGRAALKQSAKYAKGRPGTIFCIVSLSRTIGGFSYAAAKAVANAGLPLWVQILVASFLSILSSVVSAYVALVGIVMYFICKSHSEPVHTE